MRRMSEMGDVLPECLCRADEYVRVHIYKVEAILQNRVFGGAKSKRLGNPGRNVRKHERYEMLRNGMFLLYSEWKSLQPTCEFAKAKRGTKK